MNKSEEDTPVAPLSRAAIKSHIRKYRLIDTDDDEDDEDVNIRSKYRHKSTKEHQNTFNSNTSDFVENYDSG